MNVESINEERKRQGLSIKELSEKAKLPQSTVEKVLFGIVKHPRIDTIQAIEQALKTNSNATKKDPYEDLINKLDVVQLNDAYAIPLVGNVVAGVPVESPEYLEGYVYISYRPSNEYFALIARGDSMIGAGIVEKSILIIHKQNYAENNDIVIALLNNEATVKRFKTFGETCFLFPENKAYEPIPITEKDNLIILGKVVEIRNKV